MKILSEAKKRKMRIAVAKDVVNRITMGKLLANIGSYILLRNSYSYSHTIFNTPTQAEKKCTVCAIGGAFLSFARLYNNVEGKLKDGYSGVDMYNLLYECFSHKQLSLMEDCFENQDYTENDTDRLLIIMQNIVDHKGDFKPKVKYEIVME